MTKIHLISSAEKPPREGEDLIALCGAKILKARLSFTWDISNFGDAANLNSVRICAQCYAIKPHCRYLAGAVNGQEALTESVA